MRITVDLDDPSTFEIIKAWNRLERWGDGDVHGRVSASGTGVHLKVHGFRGDVTDTLKPRAIVGDDPDRIYYDSAWEAKPKQILFASKPERGDHAGEWRDNREELLADWRVRAPKSVRLNLPSRLEPRG